MKVSTDACIQGAWAARQVQQYYGQKETFRLLDIGTGTGLLSLMLAQLHATATVEAIELNKEAYEQALENFVASPWKDRLDVKHTSLADFLQTTKTPRKYDLIICNPPFFHNQLQAPLQARNEARHSISLSKEALAAAVARLMEQGMFCVMYPEREWEDWMQAAKAAGLFCNHLLEVQPRPDLAVNRMIGFFSKKPAITVKEHLLIYEADKSYTSAFRRLLQPYYLAL